MDRDGLALDLDDEGVEDPVHDPAMEAVMRWSAVGRGMHLHHGHRPQPVGSFPRPVARESHPDGPSGVLAESPSNERPLIEVIKETGSAKSLDRPGLDIALQRLSDGSADALLVVKLDRLTRSVRDLSVLFDRFFQHPRWALLSVSESIDTRSAAGRLVLNVLTCVAQWEREAIGERTSAALRHKAANREYTGGRTPYGWRLGTDGKHLEENPAEQAVIAEAFRVGLASRGPPGAQQGDDRQLHPGGVSPLGGAHVVVEGGALGDALERGVVAGLGADAEPRQPGLAELALLGLRLVEHVAGGGIAADAAQVRKGLGQGAEQLEPVVDGQHQGVAVGGEDLGDPGAVHVAREGDVVERGLLVADPEGLVAVHVAVGARVPGAADGGLEDVAVALGGGSVELAFVAHGVQIALFEARCRRLAGLRTRRAVAALPGVRATGGHLAECPRSGHDEQLGRIRWVGPSAADRCIEHHRYRARFLCQRHDVTKALVGTHMQELLLRPVDAWCRRPRFLGKSLPVRLRGDERGDWNLDGTMPQQWAFAVSEPPDAWREFVWRARIRWPTPTTQRQQHDRQRTRKATQAPHKQMMVARQVSRSLSEGRGWRSVPSYCMARAYHLGRGVATRAADAGI